MALMIREYTGDKFIKTNEIKTPLNLTEATIETNVSDEAIDPNSLMVEIEGIHAYPHATRNFTRYMSKCLKNSISLWTTPYRRPLIKHHNEETGKLLVVYVPQNIKLLNFIGNTCSSIYSKCSWGRS